MQSSNVVVVVGCGGKGLPCARRLGIGRQVLLADVSADRLSIAATALHNEGYFVHTALVDISSFDSVNELAQKAFVIGPVETIILAAGVGPAADCARTVYEIDLLGTINVIDAFLPIVQAGSNFVCISGMAGHLCPPLDPAFERHLATASRERLLAHPDFNINEPGPQGAAAAYGLSMRGKLVRVQASAAAWGSRGARINCVSPGVIPARTDQRGVDGSVDNLVRISPARRAVTPADIVNAVAFLVNPASCFITGTDILVDGGIVSSMRWDTE
ncbi:3-alpha-hydroxysteroid dehydrogenase/carbonyl reductase [Colletotrichum fructicola]|uniref:3-alpha-hydroxysteroid dehydrogenase/carbonyl reductase n=1 Tax=Colletotrichum fructicola (strain Nara gc5) TaxID=1213859 RepID=L2FEA1_COLFN|nr:uncharacterized protein CGMCC3_g542 [Colletotrichum fructicola]KAF4486972.1 3-alpha-hydroxysteroid dehydrogenase/carbonyl reductase [Colletotrichum fructicola Nara gc5]KAE9583820.1 hypothetical protein CGMCC3_g542 [Colletotrichum fructicola]KAF4433625.1 3-alpha-hydroxysteroid dehydrogenase/carbonyl reductase [Colletotrichum fructicola]KAF4885407.1 3-alpha-hydroxysteroid dehydrogenase/carbonyl reductase [Colletotrichum fructicola]KAF4914075.1 3-alpha-hydroxysteroid dehydrogenase/carbonyl red